MACKEAGTNWGYGEERQVRAKCWRSVPHGAGIVREAQRSYTDFELPGIVHSQMYNVQCTFYSTLTYSEHHMRHPPPRINNERETLD